MTINGNVLFAYLFICFGFLKRPSKKAFFKPKSLLRYFRHCSFFAFSTFYDRNKF